MISPAAIYSISVSALYSFLCFCFLKSFLGLSISNCIIYNGHYMMLDCRSLSSVLYHYSLVQQCLALVLGGVVAVFKFSKGHYPVRSCSVVLLKCACSGNPKRDYTTLYEYTLILGANGLLFVMIVFASLESSLEDGRIYWTLFPISIAIYYTDYFFSCLIISHWVFI